MPNHDSDLDPGEVTHARDSEGNEAEAGLVRQLSELARELRAEPDMTSLLNHVVAAAVNEIDGAAHGGITLLEQGRVRAVAATDELVEKLDDTQNVLGEGPCLSSLRDAITVRSRDFSREERWPRFTAAALQHGVHAMLSVQLFVDGDNLGALNLYGRKVDAFHFADESTAMALAAHAAVAMKGGRVESNLRIALESRDTIGQAKGILMERYKISAQAAFDLLVMSSQRRNRKLRDIADDLTTMGYLHVD